MNQQGLPEQQQPKQEKKGFGLFKKKVAATGPNLSDVLEQTTTIDRRLRMLESRHNDLNKRIQLTDKNILNKNQLLTKETRAMDSDILDLKKQIHDLKNKMEIIISELKTCARKENLDTLRKYIDLWNPVNFVTKNEINKIIDEKLSEK